MNVKKQCHTITSYTYKDTLRQYSAVTNVKRRNKLAKQKKTKNLTLIILRIDYATARCLFWNGMVFLKYSRYQSETANTVNQWFPGTLFLSPLFETSLVKTNRLVHKHGTYTNSTVITQMDQKRPLEVFCKKKVFLEISQENTCARLFFDKVAGLRQQNTSG